ncbi:AraC family transcriptional regulator [Myxococcus sp. MISCRS1]|jgi:AraC family transcriptional regulator|uniref:AraC family transcriptional regulator n=1 Tax=Myxococcus TaxID=32 RepID=UPI001CC00CDA|nr:MULTISPECIES: AraC family transcriptional regulator [unclassified Myxococcus]MBZ4399834.1 AraC family transcriptional regulator [Myxococcus sp. AS-1-15]MCY0997667.1 AraC family transcriptional regulator [Myxococcus sp. MISCRS1]
MSEHARRPRVGLGVDLRTTRAGDRVHLASSDHVLNIHAGEPVRVSCLASQHYSVRTRGELFLLPAGHTDTWVEDDDSVGLDLRLPHSLLQRAAEDMGLDPDRVGVALRHHFRDAQLEHIAWALEAEARADFPNGLLYRESLGLALAARLLSHYRAEVEVRGGLSADQLQRVTDYVETHLDEDLSLATLARVAAVSASHLKTLFKRSTGLPVHEYVIQRRVERARTLLLRGELPTGQVALEAGFSHQSHMARWMRRVLGVTPGDILRSRA